jgi:Tol biopolymer transport system component
VKILDFGLAKAFAADEAGAAPEDSPTMSRAATAQGALLGTAAYMSPEQARGKTVDRRTDLWAFGCVLYEMLSGRRAFDGEDATEILVAVVRAEPDLQALPPATPAKLRDLLRRCLQKDNALRMRDAGDARLEIDEALAAPATADPRGAGGDIRAPARRLSLVRASALLAALVMSGVAGWYLRPTPASPPRPVSRTVIPLPPGVRLAALDRLTVTISPDGGRVAYVATRDGRQQLYLRAMDSLETRPLAHTDGATTPFFSPDGQWLGFLAGARLKKISVDGGAAVTLCDAQGAIDPSWDSEGTIVFAKPGGPLQQVSDTGGTPRPLTRLEAGDIFQVWPQLLPGGKAVLFSVAPPARIAVSALETGRRRYLIQNVQLASQPHYLRPGYLIYTGGEAVMAAPFDARTLRVTGDPVPVVEGTMRTRPGLIQYSVSATGSLVYVSGSGQDRQRRLVWVDRQGVEQPLPAPPQAYFYPRLSPGDRRIAVSIRQSDVQVWLYDARRNTLTRRTVDGSGNVAGPWSPDGRRLAFYSVEQEHFGIRQLADDNRGPKPLVSSPQLVAASSWSPDGKVLAFTRFDPAAGVDIWILQMSDLKARPFLKTRFNETAPTFSPDGHWLAYVSNESGRSEVYVSQLRRLRRRPALPDAQSRPWAAGTVAGHRRPQLARGAEAAGAPRTLSLRAAFALTAAFLALDRRVRRRPQRRPSSSPASATPPAAASTRRPTRTGLCGQRPSEPSPARVASSGPDPAQVGSGGRSKPR